MVAALAEAGFDGVPPPTPVTAESPLDEILGFLAAAEPGYEDLFKGWLAGLPPIENVERHTEVIKGVDDNDITLHVHQPKQASAAASQPSTCSGERAPTIAPVTPGQARVQATSRLTQIA